MARSELSKPKAKVAIMYGGRSAEHEISVITALQAALAIDTCKYDIFPIYLAPNGKWYTGKALWNKSFYKRLENGLDLIQEVTLLPDPSIGGFINITKDQIDLKKVIKTDVCFLAFHGQYGEDGCLQGLLELADLPYTGCGVAASAIAMNKFACKSFLKSHDVPVLPCAIVRKEKVMQSLSVATHDLLHTPGLNQFPLFVKPCNLGSSIGISKAQDIASLGIALAKALRYDDEVIVEPCIEKMIEINISIVDIGYPRASVVEIPIAQSQVLTYEDKYLRGGKSKSSHTTQGMASLNRHIDPQDLDPVIKQKVTSYAKKAFELLGVCGACRFDFIFDLEKGQLYFNELNPIPGSLAFYLWEKSDPQVLYTQLIDNMIVRSLERRALKLTLERNIPFRALTKST